MQESNPANRRDFLRTGATLGAAACVSATLANPAVAQQASELQPSGNNTMNLPVITKKRTLGSGDFRMEVSALGFGVMGMNYNRGPHPDRKALIALLHQAAERGVTLFDTAQVYGPLINEELAGEGLYPYRNKVSVTTKFGHSIVDGKYETGKLNSRPTTFAVSRTNPSSVSGSMPSICSISIVSIRTCRSRTSRER